MAPRGDGVDNRLDVRCGRDREFSSRTWTGGGKHGSGGRAKLQVGWHGGVRTRRPGRPVGARGSGGGTAPHCCACSVGGCLLERFGANWHKYFYNQCIIRIGPLASNNQPFDRRCYSPGTARGCGPLARIPGSPRLAGRMPASGPRSPDDQRRALFPPRRWPGPGWKLPGTIYS